MQGGGEVEIVTDDSVEWSAPPARDEAGSPNTVGAIALAAAIRQLTTIGMDVVARHEAELTEYILSKFSGWKSIHLFCNPEPEKAATRLGVIPLNMDGYSHYLLAAILGYEYGIGVRNGCFCAHPYLLKLMKVGELDAAKVRTEILKHDKSDVPGLVRISFGLYNTTAEVDELILALKEIELKKYKGRYVQEIASGAYIPDGWNANFDAYLSIQNNME
jgi:selenocysteine lyase/cysteine desulfurase